MSLNYIFAHRELRDFAFNDPRTLTRILADPAGLEAMARAWNQLAEASGEPGRVTAADFAAWSKPCADRRIAVMRVPNAENMTDALLVGVVAPPPETRYFTLEATMTGGQLEKVNGVVLCEWRLSEGSFSHALYDVPVDSADPDRFAELVDGVLRKAG